jgi:hypothetical protein
MKPFNKVFYLTSDGRRCQFYLSSDINPYEIMWKEYDRGCTIVNIRPSVKNGYKHFYNKVIDKI